MKKLPSDKNLVIIGDKVLSNKVLEIILQETPSINIKHILIDLKDNPKEPVVYQNVMNDIINKLTLVFKNEGYESVVLAIADNNLRKQLFEILNTINSNLIYKNVIAKNTVIGKEVILGKGVIMFPNSIINCDTKIDDFCIIHENVSIGFECLIKKFISLSINTTIGDNVSIGELTNLEMSTNVLQNIHIGSQCTINNNTLVNNNVSDFNTVSGIPGIIIN